MDSKPLIIGCGNEARGDDAAGILVARALRDLGFGGSEHSGEALSLLELMSGAGFVILVDAVVSGSARGSVHRLEWTARRPDGSTGGDLMESLAHCGFSPARCASTHGFGLSEAIRMARALGRLPERLVLFGIEGSCFLAGMEPSPAVLEGIQRAVEMIRNEVDHCTKHP